MPSRTHQTLVELFRERPMLAAELLTGPLGLALPPFARAVPAPATLDELVPTEFRADAVIELQGVDGRPALSVIVEVQLAIKDDKPFSWPAYLAVLRSRQRCPVCLLVVAPDASVARWAATPLALGPGMGAITPRVLGPREVPAVCDDARAVVRPPKPRAS